MCIRDRIIDAYGTNPANAERHIKLAEKLISLARKDKIKLIFILGAGSLQTGNDRHLFIKDIEKMPDSETWINTPRQQLKELQYLEAITDVAVSYTHLVEDLTKLSGKVWKKSDIV